MGEIGSFVGLTEMVVIDLVVVTVCTVVLLRFARLSHSHPGTIYLVFHLYTFTLRLLGLLFGADTLFSSLAFLFEPVTNQEIVRASIYGEVALIAMTVAWCRASIVDHRRTLKSGLNVTAERKDLSLRHIWAVVVVVFPLGIFGLYAFALIPGFESERIELGEWQSSGWLFITQVWTGLALLALIYWYGFRWWLTTLMSVYLVIMAYQGVNRFRVMIPALLLIQIYLDRRNKKWPPLYIVGLIAVLALLFFPLKNIGRMAQEGEAIAQIADNSRESINTALVAEAPDQKFLDLFACALTLVDQNEKFYYGSTYLNLVTLPVPRQWWPDKPSLADYLKDISRPWRPMDEMGMIVTYLGESYVNFGFWGVIIVPYLLAYWLALAYFRAYKGSYFSVARFAYLLLACNLVQVFRDGLVSIVVFTCVNMMPLTLIALLHFVLPLKGSSKLPKSVAASQ